MFLVHYAENSVGIFLGMFIIFFIIVPYLMLRIATGNSSKMLKTAMILTQATAASECYQQDSLMAKTVSLLRSQVKALVDLFLFS